MWYIIGIVAIVAVIGFWLMGINNKLVVLKENFQNSWSQVDVVLKERADLVGNLVETVKGSAKHEGETLTNVIQARNQAYKANTPEQAMEAANEMSGALSRLMMLTEQYPDLKANQNFSQLQDKLSELESKIAKYRQFYNDSCLVYNRYLKVFPNNIVGGWFNFNSAKYFEVSEEDRKVPTVKF